MASLNLFAEGQTEQTFADTVLKPHLAKHGVYMDTGLILIANALTRKVKFIGEAAETSTRCKETSFALLSRTPRMMYSSRR